IRAADVRFGRSVPAIAIVLTQESRFVVLRFLRGQERLVGKFGGAFQRRERRGVPCALKIRMAVRRAWHDPGFRALACKDRRRRHKDQGKNRSENSGLHCYLLTYSRSGKRMMKPSRFGIRTLGNVCAFIVSFSPMSLFSERI